jgi:branched-chain amino acid transport system substrate-binding protein
VTETGVGASTFADGAKATKAWEMWVNSHGGIDGHPVTVEVKDDQTTGSVALAVTQELVESKKALALVGGMSPIATASALPFLEEKHIPLINAGSALPQTFTSPVIFPIAQTPQDNVLGTMNVIKKAGQTNIALVACVETPACAAIDPILAATGPTVGVEYKGMVTVSSSASDYTAQCLKLRDEGATLIWLATGTAVSKNFMASCARQDYLPTYFFKYNAFTSALLELPGLDALGSSFTIPYFADAPMLSDFHSAMKESGNANSEGVAAINTWVALEMFQTAMERYLPTIGDRAPTTDDVYQAMYTIANEDLGGLIPQKVSYSKADQHPSISCEYTTGVKEGKYTLPSGLEPICSG